MSLPCPIQAECGGCPAMPRSVDEQLAHKAHRVQQAIGRKPDRLVPSPRMLGYRARIELRPGPDGRLGYAQPRSHVHVPVDACAIARPEMAVAVASAPRMPAGVRSVEIRTDGRRVVAAVRGGRGADLAGLGWPGVDGIALGGRPLRGEVDLEIAAGGVRHRLGPETFFQVNLEVNEILAGAVREEVRACEPSAVLDLFGGSGNLSFPISADGVPSLLIERDTAAVRDARRTIASLGLRAEVRASDAGCYRAGDAVFDVAILDPPRAGAPGVVAELILTRPRAIVYVSCNPWALARDVRPALAAGYRVSRLDLLDMFPQTSHVEALAVLRRS